MGRKKKKGKNKTKNKPQKTKILKNGQLNDIVVVKTSLKPILINNNDFMVKLNDIGSRINELTIHVYQFLRCWILDKYENNLDISKITADHIFLAFKVLINENIKVKEKDEQEYEENTTIENNEKDTKSEPIRRAGPKLKGLNLIIFTELNNFYLNTYSKLDYNLEDKINGAGLSQIIRYASIDILTNIENNIKQHFTDYLKCYVNGCFKEEHDKIINESNTKDKPFRRS